MKKKLKKTSIKKPPINDKSISFANGVYGIALDTSITQVKEQLGEPSVRITLSDSEIILGYGRSHWFYFKFNQLVMIDSQSLILDQISLNKIPARKSFDNKSWTIDHSFNSSNNAQLTLGAAFSVTKKLPQRAVENDQILTLHWIIENEIYNGNKIKKLNGFTLAKRDYKPHLSIDAKDLQKDLSVINKAYQTLQEAIPLDAEFIEQELGKPLAVIFIKADEKIVIYNPYLYIKYSNDEIREIHYSDNLLKASLVDKSTLGLWQLGKLFDRQNLVNAIDYLPKDGFKTGANISFDADNYQLDVSLDSIDNHEKISGISFYIY